MASSSAIKIRMAFLEDPSSIRGWVGSILRQVECIRGFKLQRSRALSVRVLLAAFQPGRYFWGRKRVSSWWRVDALRHQIRCKFSSGEPVRTGKTEKVDEGICEASVATGIVKVTQDPRRCHCKLIICASSWYANKSPKRAQRMKVLAVFS